MSKSVEDQLKNLGDRLGANRYHVDEGHGHLEVNQEAVKAHGCAQTIANACPAHVYSVAEDGSLKADYVACLECGTCLAVAPKGTLVWRYPRAGKGISFRQG